MFSSPGGSSGSLCRTSGPVDSAWKAVDHKRRNLPVICIRELPGDMDPGRRFYSALRVCRGYGEPRESWTPRSVKYSLHFSYIWASLRCDFEKPRASGWRVGKQRLLVDPLAVE